MKNLIKTFGFAILAFAFIAFLVKTSNAAFSVPWTATSTTQGWVFPGKVNGVEQSVLGTLFMATSTTATSTFAGGLTVDTNTLVVDYATNSVGMGTTTTTGRLSIQGSGTGDATRALTVFNGNGTKTVELRDNARLVWTDFGDLSGGNDFYLHGTNGTIFLRPTARNQNNALSITAGGNGTKLSLYSAAAVNDVNLSRSGVGTLNIDATLVGISTTTPNNKLDIYSTTKAAIGFSGASGDTNKFTMGYDVTNGRFAIASSTALGTTDRLVINGSGSVGIASTTPGFPFSVLGASFFGVTGASASVPLTVFVNSSDATQNALKVSNYTAFAHSGNIADFSMVNGTDTGKVVKITNIGSGDSLFIEDSASTDATPIVATAAGSFGVATSTPWRTLSVEGTVALKSLTGATGGTNQDLCIVAATNDVVNETTGTCIVSSRRWKHDIQDLAVSGLDLVRKLTPRSFKRDGDDVSVNPDKIRYGFIAEESAEVDPHLVNYGEDGLPRNLDDHAYIALLVDAVQEQQEQIDVLKEEMSALKGGRQCRL